MNKLTTIWFTALCLLSGTIFGCQSNSTDKTEAKWPKGGVKVEGLQLSIMAKKTSYLQGGNVQMKVRLKQNGKKNKTLTRIGNPSFYNLVLKDHDGNIMRLDNTPLLDRVSVTFPGPVKHVIPAGGVEVRDFSGYLGTRSLGKKSQLVTNPLKPGTYQVAIELGWSTGINATLRSNWITIKIATDER